MSIDDRELRPSNQTSTEEELIEHPVTAVIYMVCTGNAARSPMATAMLRVLDEGNCFDVRSAGTLVLEGHPMGIRTRFALEHFGLVDHAHRSRQFRARDAKEADLIVVMEPLHLRWMRLRFPDAASKTGSLPRLAKQLPSSDSSAGQSLTQRVESLGLESLTPESWEEVVDPAGGDQETFHRCAAEIYDLVAQLYERL